MSYNNLTQLLSDSSDTRRYFLSLPVEMQLALQKRNDEIHTSLELHNIVGEVARNNDFESIPEIPHEYSLY